MSSDAKPVLILGAGVHGAAIALELASSGIPVHVVDLFDVAYGATSKSSRLIHGGLRYLEYGDFKLVRESLAARSMNLSLAPQFVQPLRLYIPVATRWSGLKRSLIAFFGLSRTAWGRRHSATQTGRGYWPMRLGLSMYDWMTQFNALPRSTSMSVGAPGAPRVNPRRYRWLCTYSDAQMLYPERLVLALLAEAQQIATEKGVAFQVSTYTRTEFEQGRFQFRDTVSGEITTIDPACIVNATGAWGDGTLEQLRVESPPLFGGTKGSHLITWNEELKSALHGQAVYAEADDGRLVFILPFGDAVLVGTTDETFAAKPESAVATEEELTYLLRLVNEVMDCELTRADVVAHYSGVRPLPRADETSNAAVTREHGLVEHVAGEISVITLVGGKLTTWREFAAEVADRVLMRVQHANRHDRHSIPVLGFRDDSEGRGRPFPKHDAELQARIRELSSEFTATESLIAALWPLYGSRVVEILTACRGDYGPPIHGTAFTSNVVRWIIEHEWVRTLPDLIERRLMLVFARQLSRQTLIELAMCLVGSGTLEAGEVDAALAAAEQRLMAAYGRRVE